MKEFRNIRDRFVVQDEHTIRTVTIICALFLLVSVFASLFMARQIYETYNQVRELESAVINVKKETLMVQSELASRTSVQVMATRVKDMQLVTITQTVQLAPVGGGLPAVSTPVAEKK